MIMKSTHPFYPILIPNTSFVKKKYSTGVPGGPKNQKKSFNDTKINIITLIIWRKYSLKRYTMKDDQCC